MEVLGGVASAVTLIEVAGKIGLLCAKYISEVRGAREDAERILKETTVFSGLLNDVEGMLNGPTGAKLKSSQLLKDALRDSKKVLDSLQLELERGMKKTGKTKEKGVFGKLKKALNAEDLKWPFQKKDVQAIIKRIKNLNAAITLALQIDGVSIVAARDQRINLEGLTAVKEAMFGSLEDQHEPQCLPQTRMEVLDSIEKWVNSSQDDIIFWLRGMAGTGKSTVARTVASHLKEKGQLGASFFFKRLQAGRSSASKFFPTIAYGLAMHLPSLMPYISQAIEDDPDVPRRSFKEQFEKLIFEPLSQIILTQTVVVVIDALDECENEGEIPLVLELLGRLSKLDRVDVRIFVTSRPDHAPIIGFQRLSKNKILYHDLALHDVDVETVKRDIRTFLMHEFAQILMRRHDEVPPLWPEEGAIRQLVEISEPLFISAATICRFVDDRHFSPTKRLDSILKACYKVPGVYPIYLTVFEQILASLNDMDVDERETILEEMRRIISTVVLLEVPLSRRSLSKLIRVDEETIRYRLHGFHSILRVPAELDSPIQTFHLSFRDFLLDPKQKSRNPFAADEEVTHGRLADDCITLLSKTLRRDICGLKDPGTMRSDIDPALRQHNIPMAVAYACQYWVHHVRKSRRLLECDGPVHTFLRIHLLHWLEATSILGIYSNIIYLIKDLQILVTDNAEAKKLSEFLRDIERFVRFNHSIISKAPLHVYSSALLFLPKNSIVKTLFSPGCLDWVRKAPAVETDWGPLLQTMEENVSVNALAFSPDGRWLASASNGRSLRLWDPVSGALVQVFEGHSDSVNAIIFSPDSRQLASGSDDKTIMIWDVNCGLSRQTLQAEAPVTSVAFSSDGRQLVVASLESPIVIWDVSSGALVQTLPDTSGAISVAFSPDGKLFASSSRDLLIKIWDATSGTISRTITWEDEKSSYEDQTTYPIAFSPNSRLLASARGQLRLWDVISGALVWKFDGMGISEIWSVAFSRCGNKLISSSLNETVKIWDVDSGENLHTIEGHIYSTRCAVAFSPNNMQFVSSSSGLIKLWEITKYDITTGGATKVYDIMGNTQAFSSDHRKLAVVPTESFPMEVWDIVSRTMIQTIPDMEFVNTAAFSPDDKHLAISCYLRKKIDLWDFDSGGYAKTFSGSVLAIESIQFSPDGKTICGSDGQKSLYLWDVLSGGLLQTFQMEHRVPEGLTFEFSRDSTQFGYFDPGARKLLLRDVASGVVVQTIDFQAEYAQKVVEITFSSDNKQACIFSTGGGHIWNLDSGTIEGRFDYDFFPDGMSLSQDGNYLEINTGSIEIQALIHGQSAGPSLASQRNYYCDRDGFLNLNGKRVLLLPVEYRPSYVRKIDSLFVLSTLKYVYSLEIDMDRYGEFWSGSS